MGVAGRCEGWTYAGAGEHGLRRLAMRVRRLKVRRVVVDVMHPRRALFDLLIFVTLGRSGLRGRLTQTFDLGDQMARNRAAKRIGRGQG